MKDLSEDEVTDQGTADKVLEDLSEGVRHHSAGWLEFGRPQPEFRCKVEPEVKLFQPEEGLMFPFPSYFYHGTLPTETDEQRISIAFDVIPQD